jgi:hypothetical protein
MNRLFQQFGVKEISFIFLSSLIVILGWAILNNSPTSPVMAEESSTRTLTVTGEGSQSIETTLTEVVLGVEVEGETASQVQQEVAQRSSAVVELLRSRNVENLETTGIRLQPQYDYNNGERRLRSYQAVNLVNFRIPTDNVGNLLDEAVKAGATRIDSVAFTATDSAIAQAKNQALQAATLDAKAQADAVLGSLNLRSKSVINIQVDQTNPTVTPRAESFTAKADAGSASSSPVIGGEQEIKGRVTLEIRY